MTKSHDEIWQYRVSRLLQGEALEPMMCVQHVPLSTLCPGFAPLPPLRCSDGR